MPVRYDIFECDDVQFQTRRRVRQLATAVLGALALTIVLAVLHARGLISGALLGGGLIAMWIGTGVGVFARLRQLRRIMWCLKVSAFDLVGYDHARRRHTLAWSRVRRVEIDDDALRIVGPESCRLVVHQRFSKFSALSHSVTALADLHGIPVHIDGRPWQDLDVYALFPFLEEPPADASDSATV